MNITRNDDQEGVMKIRNILCRLLFMSVIVVSIMPYVHPAYAEDELLLSGILKSVDTVKKTITINVTSSSCLGTRAFYAEDAFRYQGLVDAQINFQIDSSACKGDEVYKVLSLRRKMK